MPNHPHSDERMASTVDVFCGRYGIGVTTFYKEVKEGRLKVRKIGRRTVVLRADEDTWREALPALEAMEAA